MKAVSPSVGEGVLSSGEPGGDPQRSTKFVWHDLVKVNWSVCRFVWVGFGVDTARNAWDEHCEGRNEEE